MATAHRIWAGLFTAACSLTMALSSCVGTPVTDDDNSEEVSSTEEAVGGAVGNWNGWENGQCVHGLYAFYHARYGISLPGACANGSNIGNCENCGACMIWKSSHSEPPSSLFNKYAFGDTLPQTYDIVVYPPKSAALGYGHVAAVDHIDSTDPHAWQKMYVMDSNWYGNEKMAASVHTVTRAPYGIFRLKSLDHKPPKGYLDTADCNAVGGWTQDPSHLTKAIEADLYFNAKKGATGAIKAKLTAGIDRADLCTPLGSCNHGFSMDTPRGAMDGAAHKVYAYGVITDAVALLNDAPKTFTCTPPAIPNTVAKRALSSADALAAWNFEVFFDMATYPQADVDAVVSASNVADAPQLIQVDGQDEIDVVDGAERRPIKDSTSFDAWRFTKDMITKTAASDFAAYPVGKDWPTTPLLIKSADADTVYVLDGELPPAPSTSTSVTDGAASSSTGDSDSSSGDTSVGGGDDGTGASKGCSIGGASKDNDGSNTAAWAIVPVLGLLVARRRRAA